MWRTRPSFRPRFEKLLALLQIGFPFAIGPYPTPVARFRALARKARFRNKGILRVVGIFVMAAGWPLGAWIAAFRTRRQMRDRNQIGIRVLFDMYWLALRHSIPPLEYALYRFNDPLSRNEMHQFVYWNDLPGLAALNARRCADNADVQDKNRFAAICRAHGFPHVETLAVFDRKKQLYPATPFIPARQRLWVKSLKLKGGAGGAKWTKDVSFYRSAEDELLPVAELVERLREQDCIVQPFIENHPVIQQVSNGALASLRIVTGLNEAQQSERVTSQLILPHGSRQTSVAGIICSVASDSGRIERAALPDGTPVTHHPDTNMPIAGIEIPFWHESVELVVRAHAMAFAKFVFLGWDVALTKEGPLLLETNSGWGAIFHQMLDGPLGYTPFSRIVAQHV
jgi:hypothetical protein